MSDEYLMTLVTRDNSHYMLINSENLKLMLFCCWRLQSFAHPVYNLDDGSGLYGVLACGNR